MVNVVVNKTLFIKDPESSALGREIINGSINLIHKIGFEAFTFKKLAKTIKTTEASVYRYFDNKHKLLMYLSSWYWAWMDYKLTLKLANISSPKERLKRAIQLITEDVVEDSDFSHINEEKLHAIVICESSKAYLNRDVDLVNKNGAFSSFKDFVAKICKVILEIQPKYKYPNMLVTTVIEGTHLQRYFAEHLPRLTNKHKGEDAVSNFYQELVIKALKK